MTSFLEISLHVNLDPYEFLQVYLLHQPWKLYKCFLKNISPVVCRAYRGEIYASCIRKPVGLSYAPRSDVLWTAVNERDEPGDELVPDYLTGVKGGGFYGWPLSYWG